MKIGKLILVGILVTFSFNVYAGVKLKGKITELWVNDVGVHNAAFISLGKTYQSPCNSNYQARYVMLDLSGSDPSMQNAFSMALAAYMAGTEISLGGSGECYSGTSNEKLKYIYFGEYN